MEKKVKKIKKVKTVMPEGYDTTITQIKRRIESLDARLDALVDNLTRGRRIKKDM